MHHLINIEEIIALHKDSISHWKTEGLNLYKKDEFLKLVEKNHSCNYQLWHTEDKARRDDMGFEYVYKAKRDIDYWNQQRNNFMEAMDAWLFAKLEPSQASDCPVHSETPAMMIDRLSIMALKAYHMHLQTMRNDAAPQHRQLCQQKWQVIISQLNQLQLCLQQLIDELNAKTRTFRIYRQFKMYNDPMLNPELYPPSSRA